MKNTPPFWTRSALNRAEECPGDVPRAIFFVLLFRAVDALAKDHKALVQKLRGEIQQHIEDSDTVSYTHLTLPTKISV